MKKLILLIALITVIISGSILSGCTRVKISDNGFDNTREYNFTDFTGIDVRDAFELEVTPSDTYTVTVTASKAVLDRVKVNMSGSTLKVEMSNWWFFSWHGTPKVTITMPELKTLELSGASKSKVRGFKSSHDFDLSLSGASELDIDIEVGTLKSEISGASKVAGYVKASSSDIELSGASRSELKGSGGNIKLDASGASQANLIDYAVDNAWIELSGASHASLDISGRMDVSLSGASSLEYTGNATLGKMDISGAAEIKQK